MRNGKSQQPLAADRVTASAASADEGIIFIDANSTALALDSGAEAILHELRNDDSSDPGRLPAEILNLLDAHAQNGSNALYTHVTAGGHEYSCRVFVVNSRIDHESPPMFALHLRREVSVIDAVHQVGLDYHLTDREQEALIGVSMGLTSKELATRMNISPNTVKAFLRLIMIKMGASTRAGIVGKLLEQNAGIPCGR